MKLFFIRHGDQISEKAGLTEVGKEEMYEVGNQIGLNDATIVFCPPGARFNETAEVLLAERISDYKQRQDPRLNYLKISATTPYYKDLIQSIREGRCLEYHVWHSDNHIKESGENISSYTTMASLVSKLILKYSDIYRRLPDDQTPELQRVFCMRKFFWACFRAKLMELKSGTNAMQEYVDWYSNTQEKHPESRKNIVKISVIDGEDQQMIFQLSDAYGEDFIELSNLTTIIQQEQLLLQN